MLNALPGDDTQIYLGVPVVASRPVHFKRLVDRVQSKLNSWASKLLSQAGKATLIKAVVEPMVLYAVAGGPMPHSVVRLLNQKIRNFFWESNGKKKMHLVSWSTITKPKLEGGLGLRDMAVINGAATMKVLWKLASRDYEDQPWVRILSTKYLARKSLWLASSGSSCTKLWKAVLAMRDVLGGNISWQLGRGDKCRVFGDPWHQFWQQFLPVNNQQRNMTVQELINLNTNSWYTQNLISCFGFHGALFIATQFPEPAANAARSDRLIFLPAPNGKFSFRGAVKLLSGTVSQTSQHDRQILKTIWHHQGLTPRVRFFMWRLFQNSVPTASTYALKMHQPMVTCQLCDSTHDSGVHALFKCNTARAFWLATRLGLHTDSLPDEPRQLLHVIISTLQGNDLSSFANHMWALWKHRCLVIHEGKKFNVGTGLSIARGYDSLSMSAGKFKTQTGLQKIYGQGPPEDADIGLKCWLDGSYDERGDGGWACVFKWDGYRVYSETGFGTISSPFHAELNALQLAMNVTTREDMQECTFITDCQVLYRLLNGEEIFDAIPYLCCNGPIAYQEEAGKSSNAAEAESSRDVATKVGDSLELGAEHQLASTKPL
ncbi:hypothetical protein LUZ61_013725 [Rhynchospora tenuis]|uniref:Reverse transcriptase zinc-binding domain-containing protein n=1 Tax=Rhynchospora tenuis TaxID=198213 RepID=A0AAD5Z2V0_9POAL|nr:hypothetical protein LUZ61_013725 [Rhynchospora tenuis]